MKAEPRGDGDYELELHRGASVRRHPGRYYSGDGSQDAFTVQDDLGLVEGCRPTAGSAPAHR